MMYRLSLRTFLSTPRVSCWSRANSSRSSDRSRQNKSYATQAAAEPFLSGSSSAYLEDMYVAWQQDPNSVHKSWDSFFRQTARGAPPGQAYLRPPSLTPNLATASTAMAPIPSHAVTQGAPVDEKTIEDHLSVQSIIRSYQQLR